MGKDAHARLEKGLAEYPTGRDAVLKDGKLTGIPWDPPEDYLPAIHGPWGRRGT